MHILVTGANGQLGKAIAALVPQHQAWTVTFTDRKELDITNSAAIQAFFEKHEFDYCINCAAYTAVDKAESDAAMADLVNHQAVANLAKACAQQQVRLVQVSTDYVYHNQQNTPFKETDATNPKSVYGKTKLAGEQAALALHPETLVIRTAWVYATTGHNFVKTMLRLGKEREQLSVVFDQIGSPTYALDLAKAILHIIQQAPNDFGGIYHYSNEGICSWYDFATAIFELADLDCQCFPIESSQYPTPAQRPHFSALNKAKIKTEFGLEIPHWRTSLIACLRVLNKN